MNPDDQPSIPSKPPGTSRPGASGMWQAPSVEEMQAMLPQYEILEILGRGGMGAVYKGRQKSLKRLVAIKILPPDAADDEMRFVERFENEAQTMAAMNHPAIVSVYDFGETAEGLLYFIMEYVDGTDVHKMIQTSGKLGDDYALAITAHVCDALDYAHSRGVIHRDIKPANILIDQDGRVKVADFGLAKMHDPSMTSGLTRTNMAMGTPDYVAPEALSIGMVVDHRADLYAVGVMLYQMLTGEVPRGMFRMPSEKGIGTDPRFDEIICKAMESDRDHRYQTASEVRHALDVILTTPQPKNDGTGVVPLEAIPRKVVLNVPGGPIGQSAVVPSRSQAAPPKKVAAKGAPAKGPASPSGKSSTGLWVTIVGVVAAIVVVAIFLMGGKPEPAAKVQPASAGPSSTTPVDAAFLAQVAAAPAARQVELVKQKIEALNGTKVKVEPTIKGEKVTGLRVIKADAPVPDISPIAALKDLDSLQLEYLRVGDISCLRGLKLVNLTVWDGKFTDVSVLQSFPLQTLSLKQTSISDFSVLKGKALQRLDLEWCYDLSDLSFIKGMPLKYLFVPKTKVRDLSPIAGLPLVELVCDPEAKLDPALIASIPTLKKINTKPVSELRSGSGNAPPSSAPGKTIDLLALVDVKRDAIAGEWVRTAEGLAKQGPGTASNGSPRLQLPYEPPEEYDFEVEFTAVSENRYVGQMISAQSRAFSWIVAGNTKEAPTAGFELFDNSPTSTRSEAMAPMERNLEIGRRYVSRVEVRAGSVRGFLDGVILVEWEGDFQRLSSDKTAALRDDKHLGLRAARDVIFHKITVREITGTGKVDAGVSASTPPPASVMPPSIANWQDVTAMVREKARSKPDLLVEPDVVRRERGNQPLGVTLQDLEVTLTEDLKPSLAVRVTYTGEAQITLLFEKGLETEFAYVLARQTETIFNRVDKENRALPLLPPVPHPADFDDSVPHELLLTLQNSVLRVWIDGRFVGEGQDDSFKQAGTMLMFTKQSAVSKVELAELESSATPPATIEDAGSSARAPLASTTKDAPFENSLGMKFVPVPGSDVLFCIHETRYRDYAEYAKMAKEGVDGGWKTQTYDGFEIKSNAGDHPVASVSWKDAQAFCKWLSEKEGLTYRLPTDREWSLAVGIGREEEWKSDTTPATVFKVPDVYPWGNTWPPPQGAGNFSDESRRAKAPRADTMYLDGYNDGFPTTAPVMSFEANKLGLFDLGGNVWEWCEDWNSDEQKERGMRGASWCNYERGSLPSSHRAFSSPARRSYNFGFRVVLEIAASPSPPPSAGNPPVSPPSARNTAPTSPSGRTVDLLALVDMKRDTITGEWSRDGGDLLVKAAMPDANGTPRLQLPYQPPEEYDFEIEFTPESGTNMVGQVLSAYQRSFSWFLDAQTSAGSKAGFDALDGISVSNRIDGTAMRPKFLTNGQRHRSTIEVRRTGLRALLDGEELLQWGSAPISYDRLDISNRENLRDAMHLGLAAYDRNVRFHKITVREITGTGKVDVEELDAAVHAPATWTDWLGPKLAAGQFANKQGIVVEKDGLSTDQDVTSIQFPKDTVVRGPVRMTYLLRESEWTQLVFRINPLTNETYRAEDTGSELRLFRAGDGGTNQTMLASEKFPDAISRTAERTLEFSIDGNVLRATVNGTFSLSAQDATLATESGSFWSIAFKKGLLLKRVEIAADAVPATGGASETSPAASTATWTDWLTPKLANGTFDGGQWKRDAGGFTTDQSIAGYEVLPALTRDGAMRVTFAMRDSEGVMINVRETKVGSGRQQYTAQYTGTSLYLAHASNRLITEPMPKELRDLPEHTLEFRFEGENLIAILNDTHRISTSHSQLTEGSCALALTKGVLVKKIEVQTSTR